jgi:hypothetical protein
MQKDVEKIVSNGIQLINQQNFDKIIFKEKLEKYHDFIKSKLAGSEEK